MGLYVSELEPEMIGFFREDNDADMKQLYEIRDMVVNMNEMLYEDGYDYKFTVQVTGIKAYIVKV